MCVTLGLPEGPAVPVLMAQLDVESGREIDSWIGKFNYAGITNGRGTFRTYDSLDEFAVSYAETLAEPQYADFLKSVRQNFTTMLLCQTLGDSPWDANHYTGGFGRPGILLMERIPPYLALWENTPSAWALQSWEWAKALGLIQGDNAQKPVTIEQVVHILYQYYLTSQAPH